MGEAPNSNHSFRYERGKLFVTGVVGVDSYDDKTVEVRLAAGRLSITGSGFSLEEMDLKSGLLTIDGTPQSLTYREKGEKVGFLKRLIR
ncbi:MAG: YabP/YqfC family sporulation protein [Clostridia bacterium]|nr:YabP/YqfC family sporulation protein [Clostridia bacterium]